MKLLNHLFCILLSTTIGLSAMEITGITKKYIPLMPLKQTEKTPLLTKIDTPKRWTYHVQQLPPEVRAFIYKTAFDTSPEIAAKIAILPREKLFHFFYTTQLHCPLTLANKSLTAIDFYILTPQQKNILLPMKNNKIFSDTEMQLLKDNLPTHIKQDMIVSQEIPACCQKNMVYPICICMSCIVGGFFGLISFSVTGCLVGCKASSFWFTPAGITLFPCVAGPGIITCIYCSQKYIDDKEILSIPLER